MDVIEEMSAFIETSWRAQRFDERAFPDLACEALARFAPQRHITPAALVHWFAATPPSALPRQINLEATFGEPPITVHAGSHFYIEALFWLDGTTSIHQHGFSGAFQVLAGSSIHSTFRFAVAERINARMQLGELGFVGSELLRHGAIRPIRAGTGFVHSLFHLDRPSLTLVVRTYSEPDVQPQWNYLAPHIAIDPFYKPEWLTRLLQTITMLHRIASPELVPIVERTVRGADLFSAWSAVRHFVTLAPNDDAALARLLDAAREVHGPRTAVFAPVLEELRRQHHISARRGEVHGADHRFFLAALLNLPHQALILDLVRERCPDDDPRAVIVRWIGELAAIAVPGSAAPNALGFELGDAELAVVRHLLDGHAPHQLVRLLASEYELGSDAAEIVALGDALRSSLLFRPLFQAGPTIERAA